jgi:5-methylcytosine-specific restriction enzyme subunit McrC
VATTFELDCRLAAPCGPTRPVPGLWPALAESLIRQAERALAPGVLQGYLSVDESRPLVRGRIRFADQFVHRPAVPLSIEIRFDEYAADILENQIIRAAQRHMMAVPPCR